MTRTRAVGHLFSFAVRVAVITLILVGRVGLARADAVDDLVKQLEASSDKVRLAAALNLPKLGDARAILPMVKTLGNDSNKDVRAAAAVGLGKLVTPTTAKGVRNLALNALKRAAASDGDKFVKDQAAKALVALGEGGGGAGGDAPKPAGGGAIYVNIGPMSSKTGDSGADGKLRTLMVSVATKTMGRAASAMATTWPGGVPTKAQLAQKGTHGFYIDGTLNTLSVKQTGSDALIECKISMLLASFPDKSVFGFLNGGAKVQASSSPRDIQLAGEDCVTAVVEDLIAKKIVPTIKTKAGTP